VYSITGKLMFICNYSPGEIGHIVHKKSPLYQIIWHGIHKTVLQRYGTEQEILVENSEIFLPIENELEINRFTQT
jgi:hypothetical protein